MSDCAAPLGTGDDFPRLYTLKEVAERTGFALRGLELDCRAGRVEHVYRGRDRLMTPAQVEKLIEYHTQRASPDAASVDRAAAMQRLEQIRARSKRR